MPDLDLYWTYANYQRFLTLLVQVVYSLDHALDALKDERLYDAEWHVSTFENACAALQVHRESLRKAGMI